jgi:hypothetical protein
MIYFVVKKFETLTMSEILFWSATEFAITGYMINHIQKEKTSLENSEEQQINS